MTAVEVAERLGLSARMVREYCRTGRMTAELRGGCWMVWPIEVQRFEKVERSRGPKPKNKKSRA